MSVYLIELDKEEMITSELINAPTAEDALNTFNNNWAKYGITPKVEHIYKRLDIIIKVDE